MATVDWGRIRAEYVADPTVSCAKLAKKYGVSASAVNKRCTREKWTAERLNSCEERVQRTVKAAEDKAAKRGERLFAVSDKLLDRIETLIDKAGDLVAQPQALKQLTGALKDIRDIQDVRSARDIREQEARIRKLEKEASEQQQAINTGGVLILSEVLPALTPPSEDSYG